MKERIARAKQALPNGYCGLPLVQTCPHPNACLTCESFLTDGSFRAVHEQQQAETRRLLGKARKTGQRAADRDARARRAQPHTDPRRARPDRARPRRRWRRGRSARPRRPRSAGGRVSSPEPASSFARRGGRQAHARRRAARPRHAAAAGRRRRDRLVRGGRRARARQPRVPLRARGAARRDRGAAIASTGGRAGAAAGAPARQRHARCVPGCVPRWTRTSASAKRSPRCARSSRSRTAASASSSSTAGSAARR